MVAMKTFFEIVAEVGQMAVARDLGISKSAVHRSYRAQIRISDRLLNRCEAVWGFGFDRSGTVAQWDALRRPTSEAA